MSEILSTTALVICALSLLAIAGHLANINRRAVQIELSLKELCDRIWDLRE